MPEIGETLRETRHARQDRHHGGRGGDEDPGEVPARARERGVGAAARAHLRQDVPAHVRRLPGPRRAAAGGGVQAALRAALDAWTSCRSRRDLGRRRASRARPPGPACVARRDRDRRRCWWLFAYARARSGGEDNDGPDGHHDARRARPAAAPRPRSKAAAAAAARRARRRAVTLQIVPTGAGLRLPARTRNGQAADPRRRSCRPGRTTRTFRSKRFRVTFGNGDGRACSVNGKAYPIAAAGRRPVGYAHAREQPARSCPTRSTGTDGRTRATVHVSARAGIVVTGTEVLTGIITDRNGPWLSERLREHRRRRSPHIVIVGDRPRGHARARCDFLALPGHGPGRHQRRAGADRGRPHRRGRGRVRGPRDGARRARWRSGSGRSSSGCASRWPDLDEDADPARRTASRRWCPRARRCSSRSGRRPGSWCRRPTGDGPTVLVLPGPAARAAADVGDGAVETDALRSAPCAAGTCTGSASCACSGSRSPRSPRTLRALEAEGVPLDAARDHDLPAARRDRDRDALRAARRRRPTSAFVGVDPRAPRATRCSPTTARRSTSRSRALLDGPPVRTVAMAESCTGGLMAARLTERAGLVGVRARAAWSSTPTRPRSRWRASIRR